MKNSIKISIFRISTEPNGLVTTHGREIIKNTEGTHSSGIKQMGSCKTVESKIARKPPLSPSFHIGTSPKFHVGKYPKFTNQKRIG